MEQLPIIDLNGLNAQTKPTILKQMEFALTQIGFMLVKAPEFDVHFQNECFKISHQFFDLPREIKDLYSNMNNPHFRGWGKGKKYDGKLIQNYGMGVDHETTKYDYTDNSIPLYKRMRDGPNQWPATKHVANFKPQMEELHKRYYKLSREISYLICEILNVNRNIYDNFKPMIPSEFIEIWKKGIESNAYFLKLCGSGGGGYILGFTQDFNKAAKILNLKFL